MRQSIEMLGQNMKILSWLFEAQHGNAELEPDMGLSMGMRSWAVIVMDMLSWLSVHGLENGNAFKLAVCLCMIYNWNAELALNVQN